MSARDPIKRRETSALAFATHRGFAKHVTFQGGKISEGGVNFVKEGTLRYLRRTRTGLVFYHETPEGKPSSFKFRLDRTVDEGGRKERTNWNTYDLEAFVGTWFYGGDRGKTKYAGPWIPRTRTANVVSSPTDRLANVADYEAAWYMTREKLKKVVKTLLTMVAEGTDGHAELLDARAKLSAKASLLGSESKDDAIWGTMFRYEPLTKSSLEVLSEAAKTSAASLIATTTSLLGQVLFTIHDLNEWVGFYPGDLSLRNVMVKETQPLTVERKRTTLHYLVPGSKVVTFESDGVSPFNVFVLTDLEVPGMDNTEVLWEFNLKSSREFPKVDPLVVSGYAEDLHAFATDVLLALASLTTSVLGNEISREDDEGLRQLMSFCGELMYPQEAFLEEDSVPRGEHLQGTLLRKVRETLSKAPTAKSSADALFTEESRGELVLSALKRILKTNVPSVPTTTTTESGAFAFWTHKIFEKYVTPQRTGGFRPFPTGLSILTEKPGEERIRQVIVPRVTLEAKKPRPELREEREEREKREAEIEKKARKKARKETREEARRGEVFKKKAELFAEELEEEEETEKEQELAFLMGSVPLRYRDLKLKPKLVFEATVEE